MDFDLTSPPIPGFSRVSNGVDPSQPPMVVMCKDTGKFSVYKFGASTPTINGTVRAKSTGEKLVLIRISQSMWIETISRTTSWKQYLVGFIHRNFDSK